MYTQETHYNPSKTIISKGDHMITDDKYFKGVLRRQEGTAIGRIKGRYTPEMRAMIKSVFYSEGGQQVSKTAEILKEPTSSIHSVLTSKGKKALPVKAIKTFKTFKDLKKSFLKPIKPSKPTRLSKKVAAKGVESLSIVDQIKYVDSKIAKLSALKESLIDLYNSLKATENY